MDAETCLKKLQLVGTLAFSTVDAQGNPQIRNISAIHYEPYAIYFLTSRGKPFAHELKCDGRVQILALTRFGEMIRVSGVALPVDDSQQQHWRDIIYNEQPELSIVYPGKTRSINIIFCLENLVIEYFSLQERPIFRETYTTGIALAADKGYLITDTCINCGTCLGVCPQEAIEEGFPYKIHSKHCLHCGACFEICQTKSIISSSQNKSERCSRRNTE